MATNTTFATLQDDLRAYLERGTSSDTTVYEQLPRLINLAERRIARELKVQGFIEVVTTALVAGQSVYDKPDRWRDTVSINIGTSSGRQGVFPRSYEYLRTTWPDESTTSTPEFYADYDYSHWLFSPTPDSAYPMEVLYHALPPLLDDTTQTNWLTDYAPELLLYAAMLETVLFLKDDSRISTCQSLYDRAAAMLTGEDLSKMLDRAVVRKEA